MWILYAFVVHLLLLGSIFVIYFRSPVITGLQPQDTLAVPAPAKRLVLIVTDGLRAESFFRANCSDVPHMLSLMLERGLVGVSKTHVPTESRPGHIALIAGLYEDPSAVMRGWKENPIGFDTLFNRSGSTYAWGANDVLHIFSRVHDDRRRLYIDAYDHELDFSGSEKTYALDEWVFRKVRLFLHRKSESLYNEEQVVFFLHLLGLDSAGHVHKPNSKLFLENLHHTESGIHNIYKEFERVFPDARTAYVMTSDHGMTNSGSHGSGDPHETDTPFFLWGAGIASRNDVPSGKSFQAGEHTLLPLYEMEQAQMAPLMSALIGLPPPMNNFGILPLNFLDVSAEYAAHAAHSNALQLLEQFQTLLREHEQGIFTKHLACFQKLNFARIATYTHSTQELLKAQDFVAAKKNSYEIMQTALEGIDYYHGYYRNALLLSTTMTFLGWICYLLQLLAGQQSKNKLRKQWHASLCLCIAGVVLLAFGLLQRVPILVAFYLTLPVLIWLLVAKQPIAIVVNKESLTHFVPLILCAELMVFSFFERKFISLGFLLYAFIINFRFFTTKGVKFYTWLLLVIILAIFPCLPPTVGYTNTALLLLGTVFTIVRPFLVKSRLSLRARLIATFALGNGLLCHYQHSQQIAVSFISQAISWSFLVYSFFALIFQPSIELKQRVELVIFHMSTRYALLCTSYESIFILMLASELMLALSAQQAQAPSLLNTPIPSSKSLYASNRLQSMQSFRLAFAILLYTFFSFFGTGNIASISSFDPNIICCFLTKFSPYTIMSLVIAKLFIPVVLNICIIFGISSFARLHQREIFICLLLICDVMGLNFLFLVRNRGSWLDIGSSISHFVIMEVTSLVLLLLTSLAKFLLKLYTPVSFKAK